MLGERVVLVLERVRHAHVDVGKQFLERLLAGDICVRIGSALTK